MNISVKELETILGSKAINFNYKREISGFSIDTRTIKNNEVFIPLKGDKMNGHIFISNAIEKGASLIISEIKLDEYPYIYVEDSMNALKIIAMFYLKKIDPITIGITGTNGKTTVTDMTAKITSNYQSTLKTYKNYNNSIGLPLSILKSQGDDKIFVLEMGASKIGDINELINIGAPKIVALLNVSPAHLKTFGCLDNILSTKEEIFENQGFVKTVIINRDDKYYNRWLEMNKKNSIRTISLSNKKADYSILGISDHLMSIHTPYEDSFNLTVRNTESYNLRNILFSIALACEAGARSKHIVTALDNYDDIQGRSKIYEGINNSKIIDSSYNANPESFRSSIDYLISLGGSPWVIMGQMGELEHQSKQYHTNIAEHAAKRGVEKLFMITDHNDVIKKTFGKEAYSFNHTDDLIRFIKPLLKKDVHVLIKASRFMKFETIVDELTS